jgi:N,N'-diacetyllegionaminate synthase
MPNWSQNLLIAEIGSVHDGSFGNAGKAIEAAAAAGADVVKFQTHIAEAETLASAPNPPYFQAESRMDYFRRTGFTAAQWKKLAEQAAAANVLFLSSPFSLEAVDLLEEVGVGAYKIPSGEVSNLPLLERVAQTRKPVLLSSGMSNWAELDAAVAALAGSGPLTVMQCSSAYPCPPEQVGLNVLAEMRTRWPNATIGFSDHTLGVAAPIAAAALGARVIEKHFTFSKLMYGSDAKHSMEPPEFAQLARALRETWAILAAPVDKGDATPYAHMKQTFEKSVVTAVAVPAGTVLERAHLAFKKPGTGISAARWQSVVGKKVRGPLPAEHLLREEDLA